MTKQELVREISTRTGVDQNSVLATVEGLMSTIKDTMAAGENVYLRGFGTFCLKHRAEKPARNISKNTTVVIPAHDLPHFKPCPEFKQAVSKK